MFTRDGLAGISLPEWVRFSRTFVIGEANNVPRGRLNHRMMAVANWTVRHLP